MKSVSRSVLWEGGFGPCSLNFIFHSVPIKIYLGNQYTVRKILLSSFRVFASFLLWDSFSRRHFISQIQSEGGLGDRDFIKQLKDFFDELDLFPTFLASFLVQ